MSRRRVRFFPALIVASVTAFAVADVAEAGDDCPNVPVVGPVIEGACDAASDPGAAFGPVGGAVAEGAQAAGEGILDLIANAMLDGASWLLGGIGSLIDSTTEVRITGITTACKEHAVGQHDVTYPASCYRPVGWFGNAYGAMWGLAALFALGVLFIAALDAVVRGQTHELLRLPLKVIVAFALTAAAIAVTGMLLQLTDEMSNWIAHSGGADSQEFFASNQQAIEALKGEDETSSGSDDEAEPAPVFVRIIVALAMVLGAVIIWIELLLRASAIFIGVFFLPFAIVAMVWPRTASTFKHVVEILLAVIFSKFAVVAVVALGGRAIVAAEGDVGQALAGATILLLACLMPIVLLHMVRLAEGAWATTAAAGLGATAAVAAPVALTRGGMMIAIASRNWATRALGGRGGGSPRGRGGSVAGAVERTGARNHRVTPRVAEQRSGDSGSRGPEGVLSDPPVRERATPSSTPRPGGGERISDPPVAPSRAEREARATQRPASVSEPEASPPPSPPRANPARRPPAHDPFDDET